MSDEGIRKIRGEFISRLKWAVADGTLEPHEAAVVLSSTLALMVAAIRDDELRAQYLRDLSEGFPLTVFIARHGADGMMRQ